MSDLRHLPLVVGVFTFALLWTLSWTGAAVLWRRVENAREAKAIGTKYVRAELLPASDAAKATTLLKDYLEQRSGALPRACA